jgi:uncharacterized membrane protein YqiK
MAQQPRILRLESPSATQNVIDNIREDVFMPADGDYSNAFGFKKKDKKEGDDKSDTGKRTAKSWWADIFGTKDERVAKRAERRKNRAERKRLRLQKKSTKQIQVENAAKEKALALGKSQAEAEAIAQKAGAERKAAEEKAISDAEETARQLALKNGSTPQVAEDLANEAGGIVEDKIFGGGYGAEGATEQPKFWDSMSKGAKVALIGGGVVVLGLITWGIVASRKK